MSMILVIFFSLATVVGLLLEYFNVEAKLVGLIGFDPQYGIMALAMIFNAITLQWMGMQGVSNATQCNPFKFIFLFYFKHVSLKLWFAFGLYQ